MQTKPISFKPHEVIGTLDGRQTQFRRAMKPQPPTKWGGISERFAISLHCPFGQVGDRLWVRETWADIGYAMFEKPYFVYRATDPEWAKNDGWRGWKPSIHMKREASRITLEITGVRVERLQDISEEDAIAEGAKCEVYDQGKPISACWYNYQEDLFDGSFNSPEAIDSFRTLWDSINAKHSWESNPWVWVVEFSNLAIADKEESQ